ncbi:hypothetical protein LTR85_006096 [Meristemomyces frigidus]|nr:hypothetical protein LTR85_006096 [Meristemomyces frigidus]
MSRNYSVTEPHPSVVKGAYIGSGRGGAGNYSHYSDVTLTAGANATGPAARIELTRPTQAQRTVFTGRGGAGNKFKPSRVNSPEPEVFQFDEDMMKRRESLAPMYHIGRGGAANFVDESKPKTSRTLSTGSAGSVNSDRSTGSSVRRSVEGVFGKLARRLPKN